MAAQSTTTAKPTAGRRRRPDGWTLLAVLIAALVILPIVSVGWIAFHPEENIWPHLISTTLPRYFGNTVFLMISVAVISACVGTGAAWLLTMYSFPAARWLRWALLLPLAIPAYVGAYALVDFLEYAGPVQTALREMFGWENSRDYWFPNIRSRWAAVIVLSGALFPYVYLMARSAFQEHSGTSYEVAQALGAGPFERFWRVGLPLARPAIAAGTAVAMMETVADFGTVEFFGVQTLTTGIFTTWLQAGNAGGAAQIAGVMIMLVILLIGFERTSRRRHRFHNGARHARPLQAQSLTGVQGFLAMILCLIPFGIGFILPVAVIGSHALTNYQLWLDPDLIDALINTLMVGGSAAILTVSLALLMVYGVRLTGRKLPQLLLPIASSGYAAPGAVLAVGILIPLASFDNALADGILSLTGWDPGLMLTGTAVALVYSYAVRFFAIAQGATDSALGRISPSLPMAARSLGRNAAGVLKEVHVPLIKGSVATALLLVFVDCVKELPATLLLRPFNFNTLSTRVYEQASLERLENAAPAAMLVIGVGLVAVMIMHHTRKSS